ncbi:hypothetical protein [Planctomicrobium sp. SH664]|uniref:hypothetical protein n=1 Tax=Planctomicrobium sp. SH664 TaxID=3448125 RepID=UPI003F5B7555
MLPEEAAAWLARNHEPLPPELHCLEQPATSTAEGNFSLETAIGFAIDLSPIRTFSANVLKGKEKRVIDLILAAGGKLSIADLAKDPKIDWQAPYDNSWNSLKNRINKKLREGGLRVELIRHDGNARLSEIGRSDMNS